MVSQSERKIKVDEGFILWQVAHDVLEVSMTVVYPKTCSSADFQFGHFKEDGKWVDGVLTSQLR